MHDVNIGIEFASEHAGRSTQERHGPEQPRVRRHRDRVAIGGYDRRRGSTEDCVIVNNTVVEHRRRRAALQFDTRNNVIANNMIVAGPTAGASSRTATGRTSATSWTTTSTTRTDGEPGGVVAVEGHSLRRLRHVAGRSGNDRTSIFADRDSPTPARATIRCGGLAGVDAGAFLAVGGATDLDGRPTGAGGGIDLGAYEVGRAAGSPTPSIAGTGHLRRRPQWSRSDNGWGPAEIDRSNGERAARDGDPSGSARQRSSTGSVRTHLSDRDVAGGAMLALPRGRRVGRRGRRSRLGGVPGLGRR